MGSWEPLRWCSCCPPLLSSGPPGHALSSASAQRSNTGSPGQGLTGVTWLLDPNIGRAAVTAGPLESLDSCHRAAPLGTWSPLVCAELWGLEAWHHPCTPACSAGGSQSVHCCNDGHWNPRSTATLWAAWGEEGRGGQGSAWSLRSGSSIHPQPREGQAAF